MRKKPIYDVTGTPLMPSPQGENCPGNGDHPEYECCCDECDYFLRCFPQYTPSFLKDFRRVRVSRCAVPAFISLKPKKYRVVKKGK